MKIKELIISVITIGIIVVLPHAALIPGFGYSIVILLWIWLALKYTGVTISDLGFSFRRFEPKAMLFGSLVAVVVLTFMQLVFFPALELMVSLDYDDAGLNDTIQENRWQFMLMVILGWLIGGFYEEIVFHGYLFTRLEKMIPGKYATYLSFVITAFLFGIYHRLPFRHLSPPVRCFGRDQCADSRCGLSGLIFVFQKKLMVFDHVSWSLQYPRHDPDLFRLFVGKPRAYGCINVLKVAVYSRSRPINRETILSYPCL